MRGWKWVILVAVCAATVGHAYDPGMHVWLGSKTFAAWQYYDPTFYSALNSSEINPLGFTTRKFYYIGLTMPDLLDAEFPIDTSPARV